MPFPVFTACIVDANRLPQEYPFIPFEFTALYSGVPAKIHALKAHAETPKLSDKAWGNVLVESWASNSHCHNAVETQHIQEEAKREALEALEVNKMPSELNRTHIREKNIALDVQWVPPLAQVVGISSQFLAMTVDAQKELLWETLGCPELCHFNGIDGNSVRAKMSDGGGVDNLAIYPALRRQVKKLIICVAPACGFKEGWQDTWTKDQFDISGYFGSFPVGEEFQYSKLKVPSDMFNRTSQVFQKKEWGSLFGELVEKVQQKQPLVIRRQLAVLQNDVQGIRGGYEVDTVWVFNGNPSEWWESLPSESRDWLTENVPDFPTISTFKVEYDAETVTFLSNVCAWQLLQAKDQIQDLLDGS